MFENTSFNNDNIEDIEKRGSIFNLTNGLEASEFKEKTDSKEHKKEEFRENARNSQVVLNFPKSDEDNNIGDDLEDLYMFDDQNSFIVYEKDKHEKRKINKDKKQLDLSIIAAPEVGMKRSTSFKRPSIKKDCSMTIENYRNIIHMYESTKKKEEKPTKKLKSIIKRPGDNFFLGSKNSNEDGLNIFNHKKTSDNIIAFSKNVEFEYCRKVKIPIPPPLPLKFVPMIIEEHNEALDNSFIGEDDHDFIKNLDSLRSKNKPENQIEFCVGQQHQIQGNTLSTENSHNQKKNGYNVINKYENNQLSAQNQVTLNLEKCQVESENKASIQDNEDNELADYEEKINNRKFHQFSFFSKEPILNNLGKKSTNENAIPVNSNINETTNNKAKLEMISENEDVIASTAGNNSIKIENSITNPIQMSFPAIKPNKNYIISIAKGNNSSDQTNINDKLSNNASNNIDNNSNGVNELTGSLLLNIKKKDNIGENLKRKTDRNSNSKHKIDRFLTSGDIKTISNNNENYESTSGSKGLKTTLPKERLIESKAQLNTYTIEPIPESPRAKNAKAEDYHDYVVVHKQNKYGNKNIDLARKSQIQDTREILYSHIADYNTLNNLKTSLKKSYGDNVKNKPLPLQKNCNNLNTVKEKINQVNKNTCKTNGNHQEKIKQHNYVNQTTKASKDVTKTIANKSNKMNSKEHKELENVNIESLKNEELIALINEIKLQNEIIEKKYIEKNKILKLKIKEMDQQLKEKDDIDKQKSQEIEDLKFRLNYIIKSLRYTAENSNSEMSLKIKSSEKVLTNYIEFEDSKKKSQNLIEDYNNLFGPFEDLENKFSFEANVTKYRSFMLMIDEYGLDSSIFYNKNQNIEEDFIDISEKDGKYTDIINSFRNNLNGCDLSGKWNFNLIFKAFPKIKTFIDLVVRRLNYESNLRTRMEEKTLRFFVKNMKSIQQLDENAKEIKTDVKQNISNLSSVRSDNAKDISNDKEDWIS